MTAAQFRTCAVCGRRVQLVSGGRPAVHTMGDHDDRICTGSGAPSYQEARRIWGMSPADRRAEERADDWSAPPDDETMGIRAHICFAAHGIKNCGETDPEWCRCFRRPGHHGEHRCACGHRWGPQPCPCGCETREANR